MLANGSTIIERRLPGRLPDLQRIDPDRPSDVLELRRPEISDRHIEPAAHLAVGVLGQTDRARRSYPFQSRGDVDAVAHQVAISLLDHVAKMDADAEIDATIVRHANVTLDEALLHLDSATHRFDHAAKFGDESVASALDHPPVMGDDGRIDQVVA
jgi:hypothetical protein